jgi:hypothetical protein
MLNKEEFELVDSWFNEFERKEILELLSLEEGTAFSNVYFLLLNQFFIEKSKLSTSIQVRLQEHKVELFNLLIDNEELNIKSELIQHIQNDADFQYARSDRALQKRAIRNLERESLKIRFKKLDKNEELDFLSDTEIKAGIQKLERDQLKERLKKIDANEESNSRKPFNYFSSLLKIAAVIAILIVPYFLLFSPEQPKIVKVDPKPKTNDTVQKQELSKFLANLDFNQSEKEDIRLKVTQSETYGYGTKQEIIQCSIEKLDLKKWLENTKDLQERITTIKSFKNQQNLEIIKVKDTLIAIQKRLKSVKLDYQQKYIFSPKKSVLSLFVSSDFNVDKSSIMCYSLEKNGKIRYFLKIHENYYSISETNSKKSLIQLQDEDLIVELQEIE